MKRTAYTSRPKSADPKMDLPQWWIDRPDLIRIIQCHHRSLPRTLRLLNGVTVTLDGKIPEYMFLGGRWYQVCLNPMRQNAQGAGKGQPAS